MSERVYVIAGYYGQAARWMEDHQGLRCCYVSKIETLVGLRGFKFMKVGTWFERPDIYQIDEIILTREGIALEGNMVDAMIKARVETE